MNNSDQLLCPRRMGIESLRASGLAGLQDLWACEGMTDASGVTTYHVNQLADILGINGLQLGRGWSSGYALFAVCRTREEACTVCERMRRKQELLEAFAGERDDRRENCRDDLDPCFCCSDEAVTGRTQR